MACTVDCLDKYGCLPFQQAFMTASIDPAIQAPFVYLKIGEYELLTVGNESNPPFHYACITSFEYGFGGNTLSYGAKFEIIDQGGVTYRRIIRALNKSKSNSDAEANRIFFDFGWILTDCMGRVVKYSASEITGKKFRGLFSKADTSMVNGNMKISLELVAPPAQEPNTNHEQTVGDDDNKITLREAITKICTELRPRYRGVKFLDKDGRDQLEFKNSGRNGPKAAYPCEQKNKISAIRSWLSDIVSKDGRGIQILYDCDTQELVIQEDKIDRKNPGACVCTRSIGTFLVNGGDCGNVLEFNPTCSFVGGQVPASGATTGASASGDNSNKVKPSNDVEPFGSQTTPAIQQQAYGYRTPEEMAYLSSEATAAHIEANMPHETFNPVEAELKIIGDPSLSYPLDIQARTAAIIVINPFHLSDSCTWITTSNCNTMISSNNYQVKEVCHQIQSGSFTTTIKVMLPGPNINISADEPMGGCGNEFFSDDIGKSEAVPKEGPL